MANIIIKNGDIIVNTDEIAMVKKCKLTNVLQLTFKTSGNTAEINYGMDNPNDEMENDFLNISYAMNAIRN